VRYSKSVSYRLFLLVACQTAIAALLVGIALRKTAVMAADYRYMYEFQLQSIYAIHRAINEAERLPQGFRSPQLEEFYHRYRTEWEVATGTTPDAIRFRKDLLSAAQFTLPRQENDLMADLGPSIKAGNIDNVRADLAALQAVNLRYFDFANKAVIQDMNSSRSWMVGLGLTGIGLTLFLGLLVRRAIAPRIQRLVEYVRRFQTTGKYDELVEVGRDDISVLASALNAGFSAIAMRNREREQFLTVAAHELKTPVTSIRGYASLLVTHPQQPPQLTRTLEVINRQSWRLARLIETLFLATRIRAGDLNFEPRPLNISALLQRVLDEMETFLSKKAFSTHIAQNVLILGDEGLLEHALWCLLTSASALSSQGSPVEISFGLDGHTAFMKVDIKDAAASVEEIQELFIPFRAIEYESGVGVRSAIGLYLSREIVRVHHGQLKVHEVSGAQPEFLMELPT
jgi:signal transduction histidine kinase